MYIIKFHETKPMVFFLVSSVRFIPSLLPPLRKLDGFDIRPAWLEYMIPVAFDFLKCTVYSNPNTASA